MKTKEPQAPQAAAAPSQAAAASDSGSSDSSDGGEEGNDYMWFDGRQIPPDASCRIPGGAREQYCRGCAIVHTSAQRHGQVNKNQSKHALIKDKDLGERAIACDCCGWVWHSVCLSPPVYDPTLHEDRSFFACIGACLTDVETFPK